jgi:FKBP-type peptidyl-prolyl cis-trans isomerase
MTAPDAGTEQTTTEVTDTTSESTGTELSPDALRAELKRARDDAAKYRQRAREFGDDEAYQRAKDAVAAVEKAEQEKKSEVEKLSETNEQLLYKATTAEQQLQRLRVALGAGIDPSQVDEFAVRLRGENEDELKADAEKLAKFFTPATPARRSDPSQGAGGHAAPASDPLQAALENMTTR